ncbi:hypothetical protein TSUD_98320 [Trifolium subterraneum]|uniref:Reverse transcriptase domain-containing protein n=1 Tax=Trifolium subterraneum TaxID=3900 RepID=A0A2Z6NCM6_TRISU|nr:hypothetical protein TSUD_98320 [Trifolium subterraneum]
MWIRFKEEIDECVRRMNELRGNQDEEGSMQYQELSERHATLLIQEERYWKQRAKMHWLKEGDMNTRFFHMSANVRSKKKKPRVTDDDNVVLTAPITKVEIQQALFQMHLDKSPGPDEFNPAFYQRWRIGSGDNIRVMHDLWLRGSANRWVSSPQPTGVYQLSVRDLLHENYKAWNIAKVRNLFSKDVAEKILETPLVSSVRSDKYHVVGNWNGIWKAQVPHKARHLLWRLCRGCLPTRSRLLERRVECTLNCHVCDEEIEDELHIFFRCAVARDSWSAAGLSSVLHNATYQQTNAMDRIFAVCSNESSDTMPRQIGRHAFDAWNDWYSVHKLQSNNVSGTTEADMVRWEKPALDWVKCNVDAAFVAGSGRTSVELCFRDNSGHFMAGMTQWQQTVISSIEGEAWALLLAMEEARHRGLDRVQFESDSKVLIEAIHMQRRGNSEFLSIVHDILSLMSSFINFEVKFVRRQANLVAHALARAANSWASFHRFENIPFCIEHLIFNEMKLKCCLDKCVSQEQSTFVEGRSILDNALIATEVIHALKRKTQGRRGELALKIYISKAYDKVDWGFFRGVMTKMGFSDVWIRWVMMCVSSVNYSVLMNSDRVGPISPGRGLRQGDPLSPYLFILVTECLTALIHQAVGRGDLHGVRICRGAPEVSHLLFADDCFLFCRANVAEMNELMRILHTYEIASGQEVNLLKSEVFISRNLSLAAKEDLSRILGVKLVLGTGIYLGLPSMARK